MLALVGTMVSACSMIIDIAGGVQGDAPAPTVIAGPTVTVTAPLPGQTLGGYRQGHDCPSHLIDFRFAPDSTVEIPSSCLIPLGTIKIS